MGVVGVSGFRLEKRPGSSRSYAICFCRAVIESLIRSIVARMLGTVSESPIEASPALPAAIASYLSAKQQSVVGNQRSATKRNS